MKITRHRIDILTDGSGDFVKDTGPVIGAVLQYRYMPDGAAPLDNGADLDIALKDSGVVIADIATLGTSAITRAPRQPTHAADGSASLFAAGGEPVEALMVSAGESLRVTIANGGSAKAGTLYIWTGC